MASKGIALTVCYFAWDSATGLGKTGDVANHTLRWVQNGTSGAPAASPAEIDATNAPGLYKVAIAASETLTNIGVLHGKSSTSGIQIVPVTIAFEGGVALVRQFTASAGAATSFTIPSYNPGADFLKGYVAVVIAGTGAGQVRQVLSNTSAASTVCTVSTWFTTLDNTSVIDLYGGEYASGTSLADDILARSTKGGSSPSTGTGQTVGEALATKFIESPAGTLTVKHGDDTTAYTRTITRTAGYNAPTSVA